VLDPSNDYKALYFVRSIVPTRDIGFLKGDDKEKIAVYEAPYKAICGELFNKVDSYDMLKNQGAVSFISTSFIRGLTLNDCIIIVDEFENLSFHELDSIITRMGNNSKIIFCGDYTQSDLTKTNEKNGCLDFMKILKSMNDFTFIEFGIEDIVRGKTVKNYIINKYKLGLHI
jgi:phosphate starvation-inducible protein PhoH